MCSLSFTGSELLQIDCKNDERAEWNVLDNARGLTLAGVDRDHNEFLKCKLETGFVQWV